MKIFTAEQIRAWDKFTLDKEKISSIELMERAASSCFNWLTQHYGLTKNYFLFCGSGNNGGDGLVLARLLHNAKITTQIYVLEHKSKSDDYSINYMRLIELKVKIVFIKSVKDFPVIPKDVVIVDALFGTGINAPLKNIEAQLVNYINKCNLPVLSIDMPSGLMADGKQGTGPIINAKHTLSFEVNKLAFYLPGNAVFTGTVHLLNLGLDKQYYKETQTDFETADKLLIKQIYKPRNENSHKYTFGHALLYAGSKNMMGAAILCSRACIRSGAGLVTVHVSKDCEAIIHNALPEAITTTTDNTGSSWLKKSAIGVGPGTEVNYKNKQRLKRLISSWNGPLVIDASALQLLSSLTGLLHLRAAHPAILTPHKGEFEKLFGKTINDFETLQLATKKAKELNCFIVLKEHHTLIACPDGKHYFNTTGNAGMATAGSGDTLTGLLCGLLAQGYTEKDTCILGVYLHGLAGDIAAKKYSQEAMIASDIINCIGDAYKLIKEF